MTRGTERNRSNMVKRHTLLEDIIARGAEPREAVAVIEFIGEYGRALDAAGGQAVNIEAVAAHAGRSNAQEYRRLALFREFYGGGRDVNPARMWALVPAAVKRAKGAAFFARLATCRVGYEP